MEMQDKPRHSRLLMPYVYYIKVRSTSWPRPNSLEWLEPWSYPVLTGCMALRGLIDGFPLSTRTIAIKGAHLVYIRGVTLR